MPLLHNCSSAQEEGIAVGVHTQASQLHHAAYAYAHLLCILGRQCTLFIMHLIFVTNVEVSGSNDPSMRAHEWCKHHGILYLTPMLEACGWCCLTMKAVCPQTTTHRNKTKERVMIADYSVLAGKSCTVHCLYLGILDVASR